MIAAEPFLGTECVGCAAGEATAGRRWAGLRTCYDAKKCGVDKDRADDRTSPRRASRCAQDK
ncbi:hypothetical protein GCM10009548_59730 [Streptomyces malaysiensis subsp. malaysiensis]